MSGEEIGPSLNGHAPHPYPSSYLSYVDFWPKCLNDTAKIKHARFEAFEWVQLFLNFNILHEFDDVSLRWKGFPVEYEDAILPV